MTPEEARRLMEQSREEIDALDRDMVAILNRRTRMVHQIGRAKEALDLPVFEANREDAVYKNVVTANQGPIPADALRRIFERIIEEMSAVQKARREQSTAK